MSDVEYSLRRQTEVARDLVAALRVQGEGDDAELKADAVEGETNLHEVIEAALDEIDEAEVVCVGLKFKEEQFASRRGAAERRIERIRAAIERAMVSVDLPTIKLATATLIVTKRAPQIVIDNEADIPSRFFTAQPTPAPKLDKKALAAELAVGTVKGAHLDNGSVSLSVRRK